MAIALPRLPPDVGGEGDHGDHHLCAAIRGQDVERAAASQEGAQRHHQALGVDAGRPVSSLVGALHLLVEEDLAPERRGLVRVELEHQLVRLLVHRALPITQLVPLGEVEPRVDLLPVRLHPEDLEALLVRQVHRRGDVEREPFALDRVDELQRLEAVLAVVDGDVVVFEVAQFALAELPPRAQVAQDRLEPEALAVCHYGGDLLRVSLVVLAVDPFGVDTEPFDLAQLEQELRRQGERVDEDAALFDHVDHADLVVSHKSPYLQVRVVCMKRYW